MTGPDPKRQAMALVTLDRMFAEASNVWIIHYSCESFYNRTDGRSPRITSIAVRKLNSAQTTSFSIHQVAERRRLPFDQIEQHYDDLEREMLAVFFAYLGSHRGKKYLHWNMRDSNYGFQAIEHRCQVLGEQPFVVEDDKKLDLSRLLIDIYGVGYIDHPRMDKLLARNDPAFAG